MVFEKITLIGTSTESFGVEVASVETPEYQAEVEAAFELEG